MISLSNNAIDHQFTFYFSSLTDNVFAPVANHPIINSYRRRPGQGYTDNTEIDVEDRVSDRSYSNQATYGTNIDVTERDYRDRTVPFTEEYRTSRGWEDKSTYPRQVPADSNIGRRGVRFDDQVNITEETTTVDPPREGGRRHRLDMGYYDEEGQYHSFRRGLHRAADRILHPFESRERVVDREEDVIVEDREVNMGGGARYGPEIGQRSSVSYAERRGPPNTVTIPCHFVRIGDLLILQGRPCQVIRITTSAQTGQYRYLGVDLFTKQLQEESSFVSNPSPSVVVQSVIGPVFKQYRVLDIRDDGRVVAMTETGDVKQGLPVLEQSNLFSRVSNSFNNGRGSVRVLVINDEGRELVVDYKVIHGSRL